MQAFKLLAGAAVIALAGFGGAWLMTAALQGEAPAATVQEIPESEALAVEARMPQMMEFVQSVTAVGTTRPRQSVELRPEAEGRVTEITFVTGQTVEAGQVMLRLDDASERAALKAAEATLSEMAAARVRQARLLDEGRSALAVYEAAEAAALRAEAERDLAQAELDDRTIRAPFTGIVGLTDLSMGSIVDRDTDVATLDDLSQVEVDFQVPERFLSYLAPGLTVSLTGPAFPGTTFPGRISAIGTRVDATTRSIAVRATVTNSDRRLAAGMFMQVTLVLERREAPAVPETALGVEGETSFVHVAFEGIARRTQVVTGQSQDGFVEIVEGIGQDDTVITSGLMQVRDGTPVEPRILQARLEDVP
jgi:membrane fusion protein, multidrug efflux system